MNYLLRIRYTLELPISIEEAQERLYDNVGPYLSGIRGLDDLDEEIDMPYNGFIRENGFEIYRSIGNSSANTYMPAIVGVFFKEKEKTYLNVAVSLPYLFNIMIWPLLSILLLAIIFEAKGMINGNFEKGQMIAPIIFIVIYGTAMLSLTMEKNVSMSFFKDLFRGEDDE